MSAASAGARGGALAVVDGRTGKRYEVKVSDEGTVRATDFKKVGALRLLLASSLPRPAP